MANKNDWTFRKDLANLLHTDSHQDVSISRETFEELFTKTNETVEFTFNGWDGKSYDGESRKAKVLRCKLAGYEGFRFIKVGKGVHMVDENEMVVEKATGIAHYTVVWAIDVDRT